MGPVTGSLLWEAIDTFEPTLAADAELSAEWTVRKGFPGALAPDHIWLRVAADDELRYDLTGDVEPAVSDETFHLEAGVRVALQTDDVDDVIARLKVGIAAVERWVASAALLAIIDTPVIADWQLRDGVDGTTYLLEALLKIRCDVERA